MRDHEVAGRMIKDARTEAGLTLAEVSRRCGIAVSTLSRYENGHKQPTVPVLVRVLRVCGERLSVAPSVQDNSGVLAQVCGMAMLMPRRGKGELRFPAFNSLMSR